MNTTPFWGGGEKWHFESAVLAKKNNYNTYFVCSPGGELSKKLAKEDVQRYQINVNNRSFLIPTKVNKLARFFKDCEIDVVIFNSPKDLKVGGKAAKKAGVKTIVYRRGIAVEVKPKSLTKKLFNDVVTHFVFNSNATKSLLTKHYPEVEKDKKTDVIYNALNAAITTSKQENTVVTIGNAGRLVEQKNQLVIPELAHLLKKRGLQFKFKIAGEGPLKPQIESAIKQYGVENEVELLGFVNDMSAFMSSCDLFISTALWEGFGFVLAEAMLHELPVIAFDLSSNPELITSEKNGYLIEPNNLEQFAQRIEELMTNESLRASMGEEGRSFATANFDAEKQFKKLMEFVLN